MPRAHAGARVAPGDESAARRGRLGARPSSSRRAGVGAAGKSSADSAHADSGAASTRSLELGLGRARDGLLRLPAAHRADRPAPLVVLFHGAGANGADILPVLAGPADDAGLILLAPDSRADTWDVIRGGYGPDVAVVDRALAATFERYAVDPARVVAAGFSDGASYALSLGLTNGDLFTHLVALSPGFAAPAEQHGAPGIFVSHGTRDAVLPIDACSRRLVPRLRRAGYDVRYDEFEGGHFVPEPIVREAMRWLAAPRRAAAQ
ncbi:MAG: alpha/beta hydrolase [Gemmatimonadaceae bacterium]